MKHFVYAFYSPSYEMVKIGKSSNLEVRFKQLSHWNFNANKSFALCCTSKRAQKRIEDTLKIFFELYPSIEAMSTKQDGYTECFALHTMEDIRDFFQYFSKRYSNTYTYVENIKPFLNLIKTPKNHSLLIDFANSFSDEAVLSDDFGFRILTKEEMKEFNKVNLSDF